MDGFLVVDKPAGISSFGVVAIVRHLANQRHVGHTGTLDPLATGVLPVCLGKATRVLEYLSSGRKLYRAEMRLGLTTDSGDAEGAIVSQGDWQTVKRKDIEAALADFRGVISQVPPMFSARKHKGQRLYSLAREGISVERAPSRVTISRLDIIQFEPPILTLEVECSRGTYIRSLAADLGQRLGCGACLSGLRRLRDGVFKIEASLSLPEVERLAGSGQLETVLQPIDCGLGDYPGVIVEDESIARLKDGQCLPLDMVSGATLCRAYSGDGSFLAMLRLEPESRLWHPDKVFI